MPSGCFVILIPLDEDYKVLGYYFSDKRNFEVTSDMFLRLNLDHEKNEFSFLKYKESLIFSYLHKLKGKLARKASGLIMGLLLDEEEKPDKFQNSIKNAIAILETTDFIDMSQADFEAKLNAIFSENLESLADVIEANAIKERVIDRTKGMLSGGKKLRTKAQLLLKLIEENKHVEIATLYKNAQNALRIEDHPTAAKNFTKAAEIAESLEETELLKTLQEKAAASNKIPSRTKRLDEKVKEARGYLKNEKFNLAYLAYKAASEIAKELVMAKEEEEYALKSKALQDFYQADQKYKK